MARRAVGTACTSKAGLPPRQNPLVPNTSKPVRTVHRAACAPDSAELAISCPPGELTRRWRFGGVVVTRAFRIIRVCVAIAVVIDLVRTLRRTRCSGCARVAFARLAIPIAIEARWVPREPGQVRLSRFLAREVIAAQVVVRMLVWRVCPGRPVRVLDMTAALRLVGQIAAGEAARIEWAALSLGARGLRSDSDKCDKPNQCGGSREARHHGSHSTSFQMNPPEPAQQKRWKVAGMVRTEA